MKIKLSISVSERLGAGLSCNLIDWPEIPRPGDTIDLLGLPIVDVITVERLHFIPDRGQITVYATTSQEAFNQLGTRSVLGSTASYRVIPDVHWTATAE